MSIPTAPRVGVLISNLGTPAAPTTAAVRAFLREFLWDPRVVDLPRPLWWLVLNLFVLPFRPRKVAPAYREIWTADGSPLLVYARAQREALATQLSRRHGDRICVGLGMRYGAPSIATALDALVSEGCDRILHLPLYPQYSGATVGTHHDAFFAATSRGRTMPAVRTVTRYGEDPGYIGALAQSVRERWEANGPADRLLMSFHGLPQRFVDEGDPYADECAATAHRLADALGLTEDRWALSYQSRFGREKWLGPATDDVLVQWAGEGAGGVDVICPGFSADCLETLEEIDLQYRARFLAAGGGEFRYIPALNDRPDHVAALAALVNTQIADWLA